MRFRRGWTQAQLAREMGVTQRSIAGWEATETYPSEENWLRLCALLQAYPEEVNALQQHRLALPHWQERFTNEEVLHEVEAFEKSADYLLSPLIDLWALALIQRLAPMTGRFSEALPLLNIVFRRHCRWLHRQGQ